MSKTLVIKGRSLPSILAVLLAALLLTSSLIAFTPTAEASEGGVKIVEGATPIPNGVAVSDNDITMMNEKLAFSVSGAEGTTPPWGVPFGALLDAAPVVDGEIQLDKLTLVDFLPDRWSAWPTTYQEIEIIENTPERGVIKVKRDWYDVDLVTTYTLEQGNNYVHMSTDMNNNGNETYEDINSGYNLSVHGGWIEVPGGRGPRAETLADWMAGYNEEWAFGLHSDFHDQVAGGTTWTEQFITHTFEPGDTKHFEAYLQIEPQGDTSEMLKFNMDLNNEDFGTVRGNVADVNGATVERPIILVYEDGKTLTWAIGQDGSYALDLPVGTYEIEAVAENTAPSTRQTITVDANSETEINFDDVTPAGKLEIEVTEKKSKDLLDARIEIQGGPELDVRFLGKNTQFTDLENMGKAEFPIAPATYDLKISSGGGFVSQPVTIEKVKVQSGKTKKLKVKIENLLDPADRQWYSADLHQHSDVLDGSTPPRALVESNLASRLDLVYLSDHDNVERHAVVNEYTELRGVPFIPAVEISPMWAHFNVYPLPLGYDQLPQDGTASEIFAAARELGDHVIIQTNHPWIDYGYYFSEENDRIPGGFDSDYDVVEWSQGRDATLERVWNYWNEGERKFLVTSTDVHDVETTVTGARRTYAQVDGELTVEKFTSALKNGNSFVTYGPMIYPKDNFGETVEVSEDNYTVEFEAEAVNGLKEVHVISQGEVVKTETFEAEKSNKLVTSKAFSFDLPVTENTWYSLMVIDSEDNYAYSNPVWVNVKS